VSTRSALQVVLPRLHCCSSICKEKVLKILSYLRTYRANRHECQRVLLSRFCCADYTVVSSICKNKVLNILSYLRNYWTNRPDCQRVVLSRLGCANYTVLLQFVRIIGPIDLRVNAFCLAGWDAPTTLLFLHFAE
jgi:hypothetical protein